MSSSSLSSRGRQFCICSCYYTHNYFLSEANVHVSYLDKGQFETDYWKHFQHYTPEEWCSLLQHLESEKLRRENVHVTSEARKDHVKQNYVRLHDDLFTLSQHFLHPSFISTVKCFRSNDVIEGMKQVQCEQAERVYSLPVFTPEFCARFVEEVESFEASSMPKSRPNTMNKRGILLSELGVDEGLLITLREQHLAPICHLLYPELGSAALDSHRAFIVKYDAEEDDGQVDLTYHYDNAEITLNICLGKHFHGGELYFGEMKDADDRTSAEHRSYSRYEHQVGRGLLHRGQHKHGAMPITSGIRYNLIMWMRASQVRNSRCPMCGDVPDLVPVPGYGDGFTATPDLYQAGGGASGCLVA